VFARTNTIFSTKLRPNGTAWSHCFFDNISSPVEFTHDSLAVPFQQCIVPPLTPKIYKLTISVNEFLTDAYYPHLQLLVVPAIRNLSIFPRNVVPGTAVTLFGSPFQREISERNLAYVFLFAVLLFVISHKFKVNSETN
jgi:hypothetical protein